MITQYILQVLSSRFSLLVTSLFLSIVLPLSITLSLDVYASEYIIVAAELNTEVKADLFAILQDDGDFLVSVADLGAMGVQRTPARKITVDGDDYVSLRSMDGVEFVFYEETLTLVLTVAPELLPVTTIDMFPRQKQQVYFPKENSMFFNYGLDLEAGTEEGGSFQRQNLSLLNELGIRRNDIFFYTDTLYTENPEERSFVRLNSNFTYDQRDRVRRFIFGDALASSGSLGSRILFGGLSISKTYQIDPYFIEYPFYSYSGQLPLPSEVAIYSNGVRLRKEELPPGRFELQNFHNSGGSQDIVVEVTDALGRVRRIASPFYFSNLMLRKGLSEYSYNLGTIRRDYGLDDSRYSDAVFSAWHKYGYSDDVNFGGRSEAGNGLFNLGIESFYKIREFGIVGLDISGSGGDDGSGWASMFNYEYRNRNFNARFSWTNYSDNYQNLQRQEFENNSKSVVRFGVGYTTHKIGSMALALALTEYQQGSDEHSTLVTYSKRLSRRYSLSCNFRAIESDESREEVYFSLSYYFDNNQTLTSSIQQATDRNSQTIEVRKDIPVGEGLGWWGFLEREDSGSSEIYAFNPGGQWNAPYGSYRGEINLNTESESIRVAASGAIVSLGGEYGLTRPVTDSFGLVSVNNIEGVKIKANGQDIGRTDERGHLFVPSLTSFYNNNVTLEDNDISIEYLMPQVNITVSPPYRSGSCLFFPVQKYQAFTGVLSGSIGGERRPLEFYEGELLSAKGRSKFYTGNGGEFYFDNDPGSMTESDSDVSEGGCAALASAAESVFSPGRYDGQATSEIGDICHFKLNIPETDEQYFDLGEIFCSPVAENELPSEQNLNKSQDQVSGSDFVSGSDQAELAASPSSTSERESVAK